MYILFSTAILKMLVISIACVWIPRILSKWLSWVWVYARALDIGTAKVDQGVITQVIVWESLSQHKLDSNTRSRDNKRFEDGLRLWKRYIISNLSRKNYEIVLKKFWKTFHYCIAPIMTHWLSKNISSVMFALKISAHLWSWFTTREAELN
jgi:hypothetical protein